MSTTRNIFDIFNFMNGSSYGPNSWQRAVEVLALFAGVAILAVILTYILGWFDQTIQLSVVNLEVTDSKVRAIIHAIFGREHVQITREHVISVSRDGEKNYLVSTTNRYEADKYLVVPVDTDMSDPWFRTCYELAGTNRELFQELIGTEEGGRVVSRLGLRDSESGEETKVLLTYLRDSNPVTVENVVNEFFRKEYNEELREARFEMRHHLTRDIYFGEII